MRLDVYVNCRGVCEEAFRFYERHLGGRITGIVRHGDMPNPQIPEDWKQNRERRADGRRRPDG